LSFDVYSFVLRYTAFAFNSIRVQMRP